VRVDGSLLRAFLAFSYTPVGVRRLLREHNNRSMATIIMCIEGLHFRGQNNNRLFRCCLECEIKDGKMFHVEHKSKVT